MRANTDDWNNLGGRVVAGLCLLLSVTACSQGGGSASSEAGADRAGSATSATSATSAGQAGAGDQRETTATSAPQLPTKVHLDGRHACDLAKTNVARIVGVSDPPARVRNTWGTVCSYRSPDVYLFVLLTDGPNQGLDELAAATEGERPKGEQTEGKLGNFPWRQLQSRSTCYYELEVAAGRALSIRYSTSSQGGLDPCTAAQAVAAGALYYAA